MGRFLRIFAALLALVVAHPALAEVTLSFHSFNGSVLVGRYPHTFVVMQGTLDDGTRINENYGFSAKSAGPAVLRGPVEHVSAEEVQAYWELRPRGSQLSAAASEQSRPIGSRVELEQKAANLADAYGGFDGGADVPVPSDWGGYRIVPVEVEFWQGRANRLHNRVRLTHVDHSWRAERLQP